MAAHEAPAAVHDHIAADSIRQRAAELVDAYLAHERALSGLGAPDRGMSHTDWLVWEGRAFSVLSELTRG